MSAIAGKITAGVFWLEVKFNHVRQLTLKIQTPLSRRREFRLHGLVFWSASSEVAEECERNEVFARA